MKLFKVLFGIMATLFMGVAISAALPVSPLAASAGLTGLGMLAKSPAGVLKAGVYVEIWTGELIKKFRYAGKWMSRIPNKNEAVEKDAIHLVDIGADPAVLIDNTSYPINTAGRTDEDVVVKLKKFETENTRVTDDELYALSYDKIASVVEQHKAVLEQQTKAYGLFSLAPASDSADTPVIETTGGTTKIATGFKDFTPDDMRAMKLVHDNMSVPEEGRLCIMSPEHANALLDLDSSFRDKYVNTKTGELINHYGYEIFMDSDKVRYDAAGAKKAFGSAVLATDRPATVFAITSRAFKARGSVKMYYSIATNDPENRESKVGFRMYHMVLRKKNTGFGAIISAPSA